MTPRHGRIALCPTSRPDPAKAAFGDVAAHYLAAGKKRNGEDKAESTKELDQHVYEGYLRDPWDDRVAKDIEPLEIQEWLDGLKKSLRTPREARSGT